MSWDGKKTEPMKIGLVKCLGCNRGSTDGGGPITMVSGMPVHASAQCQLKATREAARLLKEATA